MRRYAGESRSTMLRKAARILNEDVGSSSIVELSEGVKAKKHQTPDWIRRCVASYIHDGGTKKKKAPKALDREGVSKAFAICTAQYKKFDDPKAKDKEAKADKKKAKTRAHQYQKILAKVRKGKEGG